jgi:hypothetical protein
MTNPNIWSFRKYDQYLRIVHESYRPTVQLFLVPTCITIRKKKFASIISFFIEVLPTKLLKNNSRVIVMYIPLNLGQDQEGLFGLKSKYLY